MSKQRVKVIMKYGDDKIVYIPAGLRVSEMVGFLDDKYSGWKDWELS